MMRAGILPPTLLSLVMLIGGGCGETNAGQSGGDAGASNGEEPDAGVEQPDSATTPSNGDGPEAGAEQPESPPPPSDDEDHYGVGGHTDEWSIGRCPCEYLQGIPPLLGTVLSWYAGLLEIEVEEVLLDPVPPDAPEVGTRVLGTSNGSLPCQWGAYLPEVGDHVIAFLVPDSEARPWCCQVAACGPQCEAEADPGAVDSCLAECQRPASEECEAEFADIEVTGYLWATPYDADRVELAYATDVSFSVTHDDLGLIFSGGDACESAVGGAMDALIGPDGLPPIPIDPNWRASCPGLSEPNP